MFTGLIEDIGVIKKSSPHARGLELAVQCNLPLHEIKLGDSIAVDGACLTVTGLFSDGFRVEVSPESIERTTLSSKKPGHAVNLEQAMRLTDRLGGHLVTGHIDGIAAITAVEPQGSFLKFSFTAPDHILRYIIEKGCVAVDGISLTVNTCSPQGFSVMIIPHTLAHTTLCSRKNGDRVNIENDLLGKYVEKFLARREQTTSGITRELLEKYNFT